MPSLATRVKRFLSNEPASQHAVKANYSNGIGGTLQSYYAANTNHDYRANEYGFAQASQLLVDINAGLSFWESWLDGITWNIMRDGEVLVSTDDRGYSASAPGARAYYALKRYRENFKHSYWKSIVLSDFIAGETYVMLAGNRNQVTDLQWLNPLYTHPEYYNGQIRYYSYNADDMQDVGYRIEVDRVAYRMMRRNIFDDLRGYSSIMSVIDEVNLSRNVKRAFRQYFKNGMILGGIISPGDEGIWPDRERKAVENDLLRNNAGMANAHNWIISPRKISAETFTSKDASQNLEALNTLSQYIASAIGVPRVLYGDPANATYENLKEAKKAWWENRGIPYAKDVATYHNNQILPRLEPDSGIYLEPDLSQYQVEEPDVVSQDVNAGYISIEVAQTKRGYEPDKTLKDIYIINGRPMHRDVIVKLAQSLPGDELDKQASAQERIVNTQATPVDGDTQAPQESGVLYDDNGTAIPTSEVFGYHIESGIVDINEARAQLGLPPIDQEPGGGSEDLVQLNSQLQTVILAIQAGMPINEAYESVGLEPPDPVSEPDDPQPELVADDSELADSKHVKELAKEREAFAYIPLASQRDLVVAQRTLKEIFNDDRIEWQIPSTFHITLCYAESVSDNAIQKMVSLIDPQELEIQITQGEGVGYFNTPDGKALYLDVALHTGLQAIQADVYSAFQTEAHGLSEYSTPANYNPHITMAYFPSDIDIAVNLISEKLSWLDSVVINAGDIEIARDGYDPVVTIHPPEYKKHVTIGHGDHQHTVAVKEFHPLHDTAEDELKAWYKVATKSLDRAKSFDPVWLAGDIADELRASLLAVGSSSKDALDPVFDPLFERVRVKAIQATRLDFEMDVETLLEKARDDNNFNRTQWASAMRAIIRRYSRKAYEDGLVDGGVADGTLDSDDEVTLRDHVRDQSQYVSKLGEQIFKNDAFTLTDTDIRNKPAMWFSKSINPAYQLGLLSADANGMYEWVIGATEKSCIDCERLNGQRHRMKTYTRRGLLPQSDILSCNGFNCKCRLVKVSAKARGRF